MSQWVTNIFLLGMSGAATSSMFSMQRFISAQASTPAMASRKL